MLGEGPSYVKALKSTDEVYREQSIVLTNLEEKEGRSDGWEIVVQEDIDELGSKISNDNNPYHHQIEGLNIDDLPPSSIKESILGLPEPKTFKGERWVARKDC